MQILKIILLVIVAIIAIPLIIALFVSNDYNITRSIIIIKPQQEVFDYIKQLKNQEQFSKWVMTDPNMKTTFTGTDGTVGCIYAWDSENKQAGKGEQEIMKINEGEGIDVEVRFEKPFKGIANTPIHTEAISANETKVIWGMIGTNKYPMNLMTLLMSNALGKDLDESLSMLKKNLEK